jgi:23S rRNA (adenine2503-C2)-methyltransferase
MASSKINMYMQALIYDLSFAEIIALLNAWNEPVYRARQIWQGLYLQFWNSPEQFTNLPLYLRKKLAENLQFQVLHPALTMESRDGQTVKTLFKLADGKAIEAVLMRYDRRNAICISTQVGCAMGCKFCATGQMGFKRHLSMGEIVAQVMYYAHQLQEYGQTITNVVLMGMGEPFHNYENTLDAIDRLNDPEGYNLGARRFTISTVGLIPAIQRFTIEKRQINLAISLHSVEDSLRTSMLPINKRYPVDALLETCRAYVATTGRRISFEWALVNGVNDTDNQARLLAHKLKGLLCHVNVIPLNPTQGYSGQASTHKQADLFRQILVAAGIPCTIRLRRGMDIQAGCGQLVVKS